MDKSPIHPKKSYVWVYLLAIIVLAMFIWVYCLEVVKVNHGGETKSKSHSTSSVLNGGVGYSTSQVKYEMVIRAKFFKISPPPEPGEIILLGVSTYLRPHQTIVKEFGERKLIIDNVGNQTTVDWLAKLVKEVKVDHPDVNYIQLVGIDYMTKTKGFGIGLSSMMSIKEDQ